MTLTRPDAQQIPAAAEDASIAVVPVGGAMTPVPAERGATSVATPVSTGSAGDGDGTNWVLWGSLIGAVAVLVVAAAAGVAWWYRARKPI
jgi:hypothetical protein